MQQAIVLAAGEGQRLRPFTVTRPKVMLSVADKPILQYVVEALAANGIRDIILVVGYRKEQVFDYMGAGDKFGVELKYVNQDRQLGTAHALAQVRDITGDEFLVLPGDNLIEAGTISGFIKTEPESVLVKRVENPAGYGLVDIDRGRVKNIVEKPREAGSNVVNTGVYSFTKEIFGFIGDLLDIPDVLNEMISRGCTVRAMETDGTWLDVVYPWDILGLNSAVLSWIQARSGGIIESGVSLKGQVSIGDGTLIRSGTYISGPAVIGGGCDIGPEVCILPATSIGDNVVISSFTEIRNSVIGDDVHIGSGCIISDSVIGRGCLIKGRFTASSGWSDVRINGECPRVQVGAMLGEECNIDSNVAARPGVIAGNYCQVQMQKMIYGSLPDRSLVY